MPHTPTHGVGTIGSQTAYGLGTGKTTGLSGYDFGVPKTMQEALSGAGLGGWEWLFTGGTSGQNGTSAAPGSDPYWQNIAKQYFMQDPEFQHFAQQPDIVKNLADKFKAGFPGGGFNIGSFMEKLQELQGKGEERLGFRTEDYLGKVGDIESGYETGVSTAESGYKTGVETAEGAFESGMERGQMGLGRTFAELRKQALGEALAPAVSTSVAGAGADELMRMLGIESRQQTYGRGTGEYQSLKGELQSGRNIRLEDLLSGKNIRLKDLLAGKTSGLERALSTKEEGFADIEAGVESQLKGLYTGELGSYLGSMQDIFAAYIGSDPGGEGIDVDEDEGDKGEWNPPNFDGTSPGQVEYYGGWKWVWNADINVWTRHKDDRGDTTGGGDDTGGGDTGGYTGGGTGGSTGLGGGLGAGYGPGTSLLGDKIR
jgi:hypothetical protein